MNYNYLDMVILELLFPIFRIPHGVTNSTNAGEFCEVHASNKFHIPKCTVNERLSPNKLLLSKYSIFLVIFRIPRGVTNSTNAGEFCEKIILETRTTSQNEQSI